ncbi:Protein FAM188A [Acipenser ruthenus]|uniref:Ubiquitin carboxyl-terminal hydrolase MINDY n=1 Tax=Acipenser ruthenus TaxID=7906 RepID=A0A444U1Y6_ACIRT|nr:Protein FAM188A [Acipenser ruthenus]
MAELNKEVIDLVWGRRTGNGVSDTVFCRWTQGFVFSETEPTALEQFQGGPCAVIAPVQAFLLKNVLFNCENSKWRECSATLAAEELGFERFHTIIHKRTLKTVGEMKEAILDLYDTWRNKFGVLLFLYSVILTKEMLLVAPESPSEQARRIFQTFDPEDNGFIPDTLLEDVMKALDLVSEPEYVNLMKSKLDPEGLGIILQGPFLQEFFPDKSSVIPDSFPVYHYNGLKQSNHNEKVMYVEGTALVVGFEDPMVRTDDTPIKRCLQTKWPYIELLWTTDISPSLN